MTNKTKPATPAVDPSGITDLVSFDMVRVATENHYSEAVFRLPEDRVIFHKNEVIRLCGSNGDLHFAVPYLVDPLEPKRVVPKYIMARQFRELNPAERAYLGLSLFGDWDLVTRKGLAATTPDALNRANALNRKMRDRAGDYDGYGSCESASPPDPKLDPRAFVIGPLVVRGLAAGQQTAKRDLHPWPCVATVSERRVGETDADWRPTVVRGRTGTRLPLDEARALVADADAQQVQAVIAAFGRGETNHRRIEFRLTYGVGLPEPYEPEPSPPLKRGTRSYRFTVSRRTGHVGYVFVPLDAKPSPWHAAMEAARTHDDGDGGIECFNQTPSKLPPCDEVCELKGGS